MNFEQGSYLTRSSMPPKLLQPAEEAGPEKLASAPECEMPLDVPLKELLRRYEKHIFQNFAASCHGRPTLQEVDAFCKTMQISRANLLSKNAGISIMRIMRSVLRKILINEKPREKPISPKSHKTRQKS